MLTLVLATILTLSTPEQEAYVESLDSYAKRELVTEGQKFKFKKRKNKGADREEDRLALMELRYQFGERIIVGRNKKAASLLKRGKDPITDNARLAWIGRGCHPETERIVAQIQGDLDVFETGDRFMAFMESWRAGNESFYDVLDRTAGTQESVFYYDAMLGDFVSKFAKKEGKAWSLGQRQDNVAQSFLTYRQYRAFVEAISWAIVLPPNVALPDRLKRYDYSSVPDGLMSTRHVVDLYMDYHEYDVAKLIEAIQKLLRSEPLPDPLWSDTYSPVSMLNAKFQAEMHGIVEERGCHTDMMVRRAQDVKTSAAKSFAADAE